MHWDYFEYHIGGHYLPAMINGDSSGLTDDECAELAEFERERPCVTVRRDRETGRPVLFFYNANGRGYWLECYDRIGQHSQVSREYMRSCKRCAPSDDDAAALVREWDTLGGFIGTGKARRVAALRPPVGLAYIGD